MGQLEHREIKPQFSLVKIYNVSINTSKQRNALVVKLVDTKDLKAVGFTLESVHRSPRQSNHPIKSHNFKLAFN